MIDAESSFFEAPEDVAGQAGWMFSDMLIALMVVFLATITFIPQAYSNNSSNLSSGIGENKNIAGSGGGYTYVERFEQVFINTYREDEIGELLNDAALFLQQNGLPADANIDSAQIVAGYDLSSEKPAVAIQRSIEFSRQIDEKFPGLLDNAASVLSASSQLNSALVTIRLTFSANISTN
jgi:hypothetical protein